MYFVKYIADIIVHWKYIKLDWNMFFAQKKVKKHDFLIYFPDVIQDSWNVNRLFLIFYRHIGKCKMSLHYALSVMHPKNFKELKKLYKNTFILLFIFQ